MCMFCLIDVYSLENYLRKCSIEIRCLYNLTLEHQLRPMRREGLESLFMRTCSIKSFLDPLLIVIHPDSGSLQRRKPKPGFNQLQYPQAFVRYTHTHTHTHTHIMFDGHRLFFYIWQQGASVVQLVACWTTDHHHLSQNLGVGISEGCFIFDFASLAVR